MIRLWLGHSSSERDLRGSSASEAEVRTKYVDYNHRMAPQKQQGLSAIGKGRLAIQGGKQDLISLDSL